MRVLFTGIPGTDLDGHVRNLRRFACEAADYRRDVYNTLKAEKHFRATLVATGLLPADYQGFTDAELMIEAMGLPKPALKQAWRTAARRLMEEEKPLPEQDVFLCAHTVFYHQLTREFFVPVDVGIVRDWGPDLVVTLIDDTEHCLDRLRVFGHMFGSSAYSYRGMKGFSNVLTHMRVLFDWRATEILEAERLATELGVKHFCLATKHPLETAAALLYQRTRPVIYLSHPITEPRRKLAAGDLGAFEQFVAELGAPCSRMRCATTLIEPTTIDELRLRSFKIAADKEGGEATVYLPRYTRRWPVPHDTMWARPHKITEQPLDPGGFFADALLAEFETFKTSGALAEHVHGRGPPDLPASLIPAEIAANLIGVLIGQINSQIDARDHKLVEQSDGLVVIRPVYSGNASTGVLEEIKYHCLLCATGAPRPVGLWIYTHRDDEFAWLCKTWLVHYLTQGLRTGIVRGGGSTDADECEIAEVAASIGFSTDRKQIAHEVLQELSERDIRYTGPYEDKPLTARIENASLEAQRQFVADFEAASPPYVKLVQDYTEIVPGLRHEIRSWPDISLDSFVGEILEFCTRLAAEPQKG